MTTTRTARARRIAWSIAAFLAALLVVAVGVASIRSNSESATPQTIFGVATPVVAADSDAVTVELGVQFKAAVVGQVTGIRFYKSTQNTGTHTGSLWTGSSRTRTGTFTGETASGWQTLTFATPVNVTAGTVYTASYLAPRGRYSVNNPYTWPHTSGDLTGIRGVYRYGGGYPTSVYQTSNYWVDVTFAPTAVPTTTANSTTATTTTTAASTTTANSTTTAAGTTTASTTTTTTSTASVGNNCTPIPSACGFPDATNTGAKGTLRRVPEDITSGPGWTYETASGGYIRVNDPGAVVDRVQCACSVDVNANNATISNTKLTFSGEWFGVAIRHSAGTLIVDSTIGAAPGTERMLAGIKNIYGDETGTTVRRTDISNVSTGVQIDSGLIEDTYIHDMGLKAGDHINGTTSNGGSTLLTIRHNTVFNQFSQTDAVSLFQDFGAQRNRVIDNNLLAGGGYTIYGGANAGKEALATQIRVTNNRIGHQFYPQGGSYGWLAAWNPNGAGNVLTGNVWDSDGSPVN